MSLQRVYERRIFDDATTDEQRARVYVRSGELGFRGDERPEVQLMRALVEEDAPQLRHVVGPSGAGKTSLIVRVVVDLAKRKLPTQPEVLVLRIGDQPQNLESPEAVMKQVLDTIRVEGYRFSNVDYGALAAVGATERAATGTQVEHRGGLTAPGVTYSASIKEAFETMSFGQNPVQVRRDLEDVLRLVGDAGYRPVLVLDDTEKFVSPRHEGTIDEESIGNLYHHGVRSLAELPVDLIVAMHPRFEEVTRVKEVTERFGIPQIDVLQLPAGEDEPVLGRILERRIESDGLGVKLYSLIERAAVEDLQVLYHERESNLRSVLRLAHDAAGRALQTESGVVLARHVREVVAQASV
jgi:hypothetical protein